MAKDTSPQTPQQSDDTLLQILDDNAALRQQLDAERAARKEQDAKIDAVLAKQTTLEQQLTSQTKAAKVGNGEVDVSFTNAEIETFLSSRRPDSEFFVRPLGGGVGHFYKRCLQTDWQKYNEQTKQSTNMPEIWVEARLYTGPGSEFRDARTNKITKWGIFDLSFLRNITITDEDIERFNLLPEIKPVQGYYSLETMIHRILDPRRGNNRDIIRRNIITGAEFQLEAKIKYQDMLAKKQLDRNMALTLASLKDDRTARLGLIDSGLSQATRLSPQPMSAQ